MKSIIGDYFHYTAYGIDWIKKQWMKGTPPTYAQFAVYWQQEYQARMLNKPMMKEEWAYLQFLDRYQKLYPQASKSQAIAAWKLEREVYVQKVLDLLTIDASLFL